MLFQTAGLVHPMLRTTLLFREFFNRSRETVQLRVGQPIPFSRLKKFEDDESLTRYLRLHTFVLGQRSKTVTKPEEAPASHEPQAFSVAVPSLPVSSAEDFDREIERLRSSDQLVARQGNLSVFFGSAPEMPHLLREIGRLRELTFREVGEGTGNELDLDKFDDYYIHAFLWDEEKKLVVGAYRLGRADVIMRQYGAKGLYTSTLFKFRKPFLAHLDDALELGRSFIIPQYQRSLVTLPLLWRGISTWISRNPHYKKVFGPVSISQDYLGLSRKLIVEFLRDNRLHSDLATLVKPRKPFRYLRNRKFLREFVSAELNDLDDFSALISSMEEDGKGIPILLKHYLKLKGTILSFNVDKDFSSVLDGLILVDLTESEPRLLAKYMGEDTFRKYLEHHGKKASE
jgi:putative hemolysin